MIILDLFILRFNLLFRKWASENPWAITQNMEKIILEKMETLGSDYTINNHVAIHKTASIDSHAMLKGPIIISPNCFVGPHVFLRGGIFLDEAVSIGPGCEVKTSLLFSHTALAHFNFVGDSLVGSHVNMEAGAVVANHFNERKDKNIMVSVNGEFYSTGVQKFGALIGDDCKIGANAVLSPGTILAPEIIVKRLQLIDQMES